MENTETKQIYGLIGKAMAKIRAIGKDDTARNFSGKEMYKFRGIDAVYNVMNPVMAELGLFVIPEVVDQKREERLSSNGNTLIYSILTMKFTMYAPDGSSVSGTLVGEGMDSGDKSSNKAMSIALKYFMFQTFMIPTEDLRDPDSDVHEVMPKTAQPAQNPAPAKQASVTTANKLPAQEEKKLNPVLNYLANERIFITSKLGITDEDKSKRWFAGVCKQLVDSGAVQNVPWNEMTRKQAEELVQAVKATFVKQDDAK